MPDVGFLYLQGGEATLSNLVAQIQTGLGLLYLNCSTIPITAADMSADSYITPGTIPEQAPDLSQLTWTIASDSNGSTASTSGIYTLLQGVDTPTVIYSMWCEDAYDNLLYGWNLETPVPVPMGESAFIISDLAVTFGPCGGGPPPPPPPPPPTGWLDSWAGTSGARIVSRPPTYGPGWIDANTATAAFLVSDSMCYNAQTAAGETICWQDGDAADGSVTAAILTPTSGTFVAGLVFRLSDGQNYYFVWTLGDSTLDLYQMAGGSPTLLMTAAVAIPFGDTVQLGASYSGADCSISVAGSVVITYGSLSDTTSTFSGLIVYQDGSFTNCSFGTAQFIP